MIAEELIAVGCQVVGPVAKLRQGVTVASVESLDGAFLDVNLAGEHSFPIADVLTERGIPFAFLTGYGDGIIPPQYQNVPRLSKPFDLGDLVNLARGFRVG
jgi:hypothetical protein